MRGRDIEFCKSLAHGIAAQFGPNCEIAVHDISSGDLTSTIVVIENGHVSGRKLGDGPSHVVLEALHDRRKAPSDRLAYLTKTEDGKILKSSTIFLRGDDGEVDGIFAINYDITILLAAQTEMANMISVSGGPTAEPEPIPQSVTELLDELIEQSVRMVGKPVTLMTKEDKVKAIGFLNDSGAFLVTKSGQKVCSYFGISKYTLYSYMDEAKGQPKE
ncbi:helix-turn-helix transcriptional regulator [Olsenella urininfantis]|uniref:helix-turn-helix transcriptional regulator n=1 Tax=Olsenella urininfantis TaxID=1871033 RepID=UPI000986E6D2|nr:helix-turn-helix transcriptional regulator [Olsenella urininfantis]